MLTMSRRLYAGQLLFVFIAAFLVGANTGLKGDEYFATHSPHPGPVSADPPVELNEDPDAVGPRPHMHRLKRVSPIRPALYIEAIGEGDAEPVRWAI